MDVAGAVKDIAFFLRLKPYWHDSSSRPCEMFIHFEPSKAVACDDCGKPGTIVCMVTKHADHATNLCIACFRALLRALEIASRKLID